MPASVDFRWKPLRADDPPQMALFSEGERVVGKGAYRGLEFLEVRARSVINRIPDEAPLPFRFTINAYRGCSHACVYCFARPTHDYLGLGIGSDFETKIVVKVNAPELVRAETAPSRWSNEAIAMGTNTDPYQPAEAKYKITRHIAEILTERSNPFSILTKSPLVLRDLDVFRAAAAETKVRVDFSVGTLDETVWRASEPRTPHPRKRIDAVRRLNAAGVPSGVIVGPVLPGLSDRLELLEEVVRAAIDAGARFVAPILLHLKPGVKEHYLDWLQAEHPKLIPLHLRMYRGRTYARNGQRGDLTREIQGLVAKHGGRSRPAEMTRRPRETAEPHPKEQLELPMADDVPSRARAFEGR